MNNQLFKLPTQLSTPTAWVFPGQGSQKVGMGLDLVNTPLAQNRFEQAEKLLGWSVLEACHNRVQLSRTLYLQPCLYVVVSILSDMLTEHGFKPNLVAGYSLGEYMALYAAKVFDFETGLRLMKRRGELMESAAEGALATAIGFNHEQLEHKIQQTANVWRVNDDLTNAVIAGTPEAVESVLTTINAKRIIRLHPSRAFHTPLIAATAAKFEQFLELSPFQSAQVPVLSSLEATPLVEAAQLKKNLIKQMTEPVCWRKIALKLAAEGIERTVEIGPGKGLTKQMTRICPQLISTNISSAEQISKLKIAPGHDNFVLKDELMARAYLQD
ncbi:MAG: ACP S-malonyltransferase, partial [Prochloraceae cyanobacterium]